MKCGSILGYDIFGHTHKANDQLSNVIGKGMFTSPKPIDLINRLLFLSSYKQSTILDFFAGSGTTLHATMQLNAEDGGNRQCILVTNNENNIAREVCYERNKRVIEGYTNSKGEWVSGLGENNLRYYKADFVESEKTEINRRKLTALCTNLLQIKEDCYDDKTIESNFKPDECHISSNGKGKYLVVVYYSRKQTEVLSQLTDWIKGLSNLEEKIQIYAFSPESDVLIGELVEVADKINAIPLPDSIYNAYRSTFKEIDLKRTLNFNE